ncbi:carbonic anhydrase 2-like [Penaeus chinensis]|uniref:Carbonic anhydrase n=1 Tax=Penaeus chinensis TaxID=139456 RepID=A0A286QYA8_PENCE|nr:carbonic anhydrase 2-like [Penaeus chinensis]ASU87568.1 glycosyl-phosphatidylinositol-linked carbonic anhydrase [Penaeus chinensis]
MALSFVLVLALAIFAEESLASGGTQWGYTGEHGTAHWGSIFRSCSGQRQSPINIETSNVKTEYWRPFTLKNYDQPPTRMRIKNNGHSAQVEMDAQAAPRVRDGGLKGEYIFAQFHFHWGHDSSLGSEHTIDGVRYPMELHLVHYKGAYGSLAEAVKKSDGLAVLGVMLEVSNSDNPALTPLVTALRNITDSGMFAEVDARHPLRAFLPRNLDTFYRYSGSLTTPTCNEVVTWTVFADAITISEKQLNAFRALMNDRNQPIVNNFRPPQPLNNRKVMVSAKSDADSAAMKKVGLTLYFMTSMAVLMMNM